MCGIAGVQSKQFTEISPAWLDVLQASLEHRGPDSSGRFAADGTALIATRLAIVDLVHGDQPFVSPRGTVLVANAEIYNAPELRASFPEYPFRGHSDCEVILPLYEKYGAEFTRELRGMYAIALYDPRSEELVLSRDPFGIKPLYFVRSASRFAFASEIGPLMALSVTKTDLLPEAEAELLQLKYVIENKTIASGIERLGPGQTVSVHNCVAQYRHRIPPWRGHSRQNVRSRMRGLFARSPATLLRQFGKVIAESVAAHLRADVESCLYYSGGIDSTILLLVAREHASNLQCLTIGYQGEEAADESRDALRLAAEAGVRCERVEMSAEDFWTFAPRVVAALDDPMADPAVLPLAILAKATRALGYKVALSGEGADEAFGGYARYRRASRGVRSKSGRGVFAKADQADRDFPKWREAMDRTRSEQEALWHSGLQVLQAVDVAERLPNCLLIKLDRALMAYGVEGRTPFLDLRVFEFAGSLPDGLKANPRYTKRLLRDWVDDKFPGAKPYAKKRGFDVPLATWIGGQKECLVELVGKEAGVRRWFSPEFVKGTFERCDAQIQPVWSLLFYALWHAHFVLGANSDGNIADVLSEAARLS